MSSLQDRLGRALDDEDPGLVLGTAKELCEAVAKVTYQQRHERFGSRTDMRDLIRGAHKLVDRLPNAGGAQGGAVRDLAQGAMKIAERIGELRNRAGSGHGRPAPVELDEIDARFAAGAAILWCSWVLSRLDPLVANDPDRLARDIMGPGGKVFYSGDLSERLREAGLSTMDERDQRAVGFAVGQRGGPGGTFNVLGEGVLRAAETADLDEWPPAYREAVAEGLVIDSNGYIAMSPRTAQLIVDLLAPLPDHGVTTINAIRSRLDEAEFAYSVTDEDKREVVEVFQRGAAEATGEPAKALGELAQALAVNE